MKRLTTLFLLCFSLNLFAQSYQFEQKDKDGFILNSQTRDAITISYHLNGFSLVDSPEPDVKGKNISMKGVFLPNTPGAPDLPSTSTYIAIPNGATVTMEICHTAQEVIHDVELAPAAELLPDNSTEHARVVKDMEIYEKNAFYPENPIVFNGIGDIRKVSVAKVGVMPFQYNPVTKDLIVYHDIEIKLHLEGGEGQYGYARYRTPEWDDILEDLLLNPKVLPTIDHGAQLRKHFVNRETGCEYLIITPDNDNYKELAKRIRAFRIKQGVPTNIMTISECGGNDPEQLRSFIHNAYETWDMPPASILLIGDHLSDPAQGILSYTLNNHLEYNPYWSDIPYGDMNDDYLCDITVGRISMENKEQLETIINKGINYETTPPTDFNHYDQPFTAAGYQYDLWTLMTGEIINGFWEKELGKHPKHLNAIVYEGYYPEPEYNWSEREHTEDIVNYFGPQGLGYIPDNLSHLTDYNTNAQRIADAINSGAFISQFRDHGESKGWFCPQFHVEHLSLLNNVNPTYMMSNGCNIGRIAWTTCLMEEAMRMEQGALGMIGTVCVSYGVCQDVYLYGFYDHLWPNFMPDYGSDHPHNLLLPAFANVAANYYLENTSYIADNLKEFSQCLFHHYGDVYMNLYSEVPREIEVVGDIEIVAESMVFNITVEEGTLICLTIGDEIIGYGVGTGQPQQIEITPQASNEVLLTLKKQNCYRREIRIMPIAPPDSPLVTNTAIEIADEAGDGDHQADNDEECYINISIKNIGYSIADAGTAIISCSDSLVTILENTAVFPSLAPQEEFLIEHGFKVYFDGNIEDKMLVPFHLVFNAGGTVFESRFSITVNAPILKINELALYDLEGDTITAIPSHGEAMISFKVTNKGGQHASEVFAQVSTIGNYLEIETIDTIPQIGANESIQVSTLINAEETPFDYAILPFQIYGTYEFGEAKMETLVPYGSILEDFETEEMNPFYQWTTTTNAPWIRDDGDSYSGSYSYRSAVGLSNFGSSQLICKIVMDKADILTFYYKTSAKDVDQLRISHDNLTVYTCSGETDWQRGTMHLNEGINTIVFKFKKNGAGVAGDDCARIDFIQLPPKARIIITAGEDVEACLGEDVIPNSQAFFYENIEWTTEGDGHFDDNTLTSPTYTPGANDQANRHVELVMTASAEGLDTVSDRVSIDFFENISEYKPEAPIGDTLVDQLHTQHSNFQADNENIFAWMLEPNDAGTLSFEDSQASINWREDFTGMATLVYQIHNECSVSDYSYPLHIKVINSSDIKENSSTKLEVYPNPASDELFVVMEEDEDKELFVRLNDIYGRTVWQSQVATQDGRIDVRVSVKTFVSGIYTLQIISNTCIVNKVILVR